MGSGHEHTTLSSSGQLRRFMARVTAGPNGGWVTELEFGDGASLTKWFERMTDAERYGDELQLWLEGHGSFGPISV
jgi:hypothetical protein